MGTKAFFQKYGAYLVAAVVFVAAAVIYCFPVTQGKEIRSADDINARCAANEAYSYRQETGQTTWWSDSMFSGMPNYQINGGQYKADRWLSPLRSILLRGHRNPIWAILLYFVCFYILMRAFGVGRWLSIAGSFALTFSTYFITILGAGHGTKASTIALMSVVLAGFRLLFRKKYILGFLLSMVFMAVGFTIHPQMSYYLFMLIGVLWIGELWEHIRGKRMRDFLIATALFAGAVLIGAATNSANVFANAEYAAETIRGGQSELEEEGEDYGGVSEEYANVWSYGKMESFSFLIPGIMGGSSQARFDTDSQLYKTMIRHKVDAKTAKQFCDHVLLYWGDQPFTAGNVYMGAIVCFLFLLGLLVVPGARKWALLAATLFSVALAWGNNCAWLNQFFFRYFPLYNKFRAISSILIVAEITMPLLGFLGVKALVEGSVPERKAARSILIAAGVTAGICLLFAMIGKSIQVTGPGDGNLKKSAEWVYQAVQEERHALIVRDSLRSLALILAAALPLWLLAKRKIKAGWAIAALGLLVVLDLWPVNQRYFNHHYFIRRQDNQAQLEMKPYEERILQDKGLFRVLNLTGNAYNEARTSLRLNSVGGYSSAKLRRYEDLIREHLTQMHAPVFAMLNVRYVITKDPETGETVLRSNPSAFGNAWFVDRIILVDGAKNESAGLMKYNILDNAVADRSLADRIGNLNPGISPDARIRLTAHTPDSRDYKYTSSTPGTVVFSEIYYPHGWKATIDGEPADHFRADYVLRAMNVPAGSHHIRFVFDPDCVRKGDTLALVFIILMYLLLAGGIAWGLKGFLRK